MNCGYKIIKMKYIKLNTLQIMYQIFILEDYYYLLLYLFTSIY